MCSWNCLSLIPSFFFRLPLLLSRSHLFHFWHLKINKGVKIIKSAREVSRVQTRTYSTAMTKATHKESEKEGTKEILVVYKEGTMKTCENYLSHSSSFFRSSLSFLLYLSLLNKTAYFSPLSVYATTSPSSLLSCLCIKLITRKAFFSCSSSFTFAFIFSLE